MFQLLWSVLFNHEKCEATTWELFRIQGRHLERLSFGARDSTKIETSHNVAEEFTADREWTISTFSGDLLTGAKILNQLLQTCWCTWLFRPWPLVGPRDSIETAPRPSQIPWGLTWLNQCDLTKVYPPIRLFLWLNACEGFSLLRRGFSLDFISFSIHVGVDIGRKATSVAVEMA
jgi:hypothetical protein